MSTTTRAWREPRHHRAALQDHHLERHRHGGLETVHDIAEGIADQDHVAKRSTSAAVCA